MGILSLLQSRGLFSVSAYFYMFLAVYICSIYGFICINTNDLEYLLAGKFHDNERLSNENVSASHLNCDSSDRGDLVDPLILPSNDYDMKESSDLNQSSVSFKREEEDSNPDEMFDQNLKHEENLSLSSSYCLCLSSSYRYHAKVHPAAIRKVYFMLIKVFCLASLGYAVLPTVISIVASRFDDAYLILSLAVTISQIVDPLIRLCAGMDRFKNSNTALLNSCFMAFIACATFLIGMIGVEQDSAFTHSTSIATVPILAYIMVMVLFNFLTTLVMLKIHAVTSCAMASSSWSHNADRLDSTIAVSTNEGMDQHFTSDAFRWVGCTTQAGMTCGSVFIASLLFSGLVASSEQ